jgi:acyl-CoA reductase-like NAD-dependent aldehyde dehydrogenase
VRIALLIVDLQEDFLDAPDLTPPRGELVARAAALLEGFRAAGRPVIHVWTTIRPGSDQMMPHWRGKSVRRCVAGTPGHAPPPELRPSAHESVVHKVVFSPLATRELATLLLNLRIDAVVLAGVHLHACVRAAALDAYQHGFRVVIAEDAVATYDAVHGTVSRQYLEGRAATFLSVDEVLAMLDDGAPEPPDVSTAVRAAVTVASFARTAWAARSPGERLDVLARLAEVVDADRETLARAIATDVGKPVRDGREEVIFGTDLVRAAARHAADAPADPEGMRRVPHGVIAVVTPWNNPVGIPLGKLAPALAYGNAVVWKPAPKGAGIARRLLDHLRTAGVPEGLVGLVEGDRATAESLMEDPGIDAVTLTGSPAAGAAGQVICARRHVPFQGELGGNNAAVVWEDADLDAAARALALAGFGSAGQRCTANRRIIVAGAVHDAFVERFATAVADLAWGDPLDEATRIGPLVSVEARDRVAEIVERARAVGATILMPHPEPQRRRLASLGAYHPPTVVTGAEPDAEVVREETFGPVVVVQRVTSWDEAMVRLNGVRQGLVAALFTASAERETDFLERAEAGILKIGTGTAGVSPDLPFPGWKASGVGPPEHGPCDRDFYTRVQTVSR